MIKSVRRSNAVKAKVTGAQLNLEHAINVDLFAGGGGASTGIERGLGKPVHIAINHNPKALSMHQANHPEALRRRIYGLLIRLPCWMGAPLDGCTPAQIAPITPKQPADSRVSRRSAAWHG